MFVLIYNSGISLSLSLSFSYDFLNIFIIQLLIIIFKERSASLITTLLYPEEF